MEDGLVDSPRAGIFLEFGGGGVSSRRGEINQSDGDNSVGIMGR